DELSSPMLVLVTLVSMLVQIYSLAYLHDEPAPSLGRYYAYQSLFAFSMLGLVLSPTYLQMFVFWELVGLCSYLLIGFWYSRPSAARAAAQAVCPATMVTAGVFLVARSEPLFALVPTVLALIARVGAFTALLAATMACVESDIKRVLAYSTVSQLGYMMAAAGAGAADAGFFHLLTH